MSANRDRAVKLLDHYITLLMERPGAIKVTQDNHVEIAECVDSLIDAAVEKAIEKATALIPKSGKV